MIFGKKNRKIVKNLWIVLGIFVIISMVLLYMPVFQF